MKRITLSQARREHVYASVDRAVMAGRAEALALLDAKGRFLSAQDLDAVLYRMNLAATRAAVEALDTRL